MGGVKGWDGWGKGFKLGPKAHSLVESSSSVDAGRAFTDVPMPDYSFWGLPYAEVRRCHIERQSNF
eukprot:440744-Pleurochrysis_carterae.AAC.1